MQLPTKEISNQDYVPIQHKFNLPKPTSFQGGQMNTSNWATPLSWDQYYDRREKIDSEIPVYFAGKNEGHIIFCMHGGGLTAMSFAPMARCLKQDFTVVSFDWRGHGSNTQDDPTNLD
jgi:pimeloyl-ACP methyl ester carboxylesterase